MSGHPTEEYNASPLHRTTTDAPHAEARPPPNPARRSSFLFQEHGTELRLLQESESKASAVIDKRHMWLSKKIVQRFNMMDIDSVEKMITSPEELIKVNQFLSPNGPRTLFCLADPQMGQSFTVSLFPHHMKSRPIGKALFFIRTIPRDQYVGLDIAQDVMVGEFGPHVIRTFSHLLQSVYVPLLTAEGVWGTCSHDDRRSFFSQLSRFSMTLVDVVQTIDSRVQFKKVDPFLLAAAKSLNSGDETQEGRDQQLEDLSEIARDWMESAQQFLDQEDESLDSLQDFGPDSPLIYWRERSAHLNALNEQFEASETRSVVGVLTLLKSSKIKTWRLMEAKLKEATIEANENVKHLTTLNKNFEAVYGGTPAQIAEDLPAIFSKCKMIRVMSKYLQNNRNMTGLLVKIINQIIQRCRHHINADGDLWQQDSATLMSKLEECIQLNTKCQVQYRTTKHERTGGVRELPFQFDESQIFAKFEHFAARLQKVKEFFNIFHLFERLKEQNLPGLHEICTEFAKAVHVFRMRPYDILDFTNTMFDHDYEQMIQIMAELEQELQLFIDDSFSHIDNTDHALDLLTKLHSLMQRDNLRPYLNTKYLNIFTNFSHDLDVVSNMYEVLKTDPPIPRNAPPVAGRILWVRHMLKMIEVPMYKFRKHAALMIHRDSKAIIRKYNKIAQAFVDFEVLWEQAWSSTVETAKQGMNATLVVRHPQDEMLHVNFDQAVLQVLREAKFMRELEVPIPHAAQTMLAMEEQLKGSANLTRFMLEEYRTVTELGIPEIRPLFERHLVEMESLLRPGLTVVTWSSMSTGSYLQGMFVALDKMRDIQAKVKDLYENRVQRNLKAISRLCLIELPNTVVTTENFVSEQEHIIRQRSSEIDHKCLEIESAVIDIIDVVESCRIDPSLDEMSSSSPTLPKTAGNEMVEKVWALVYQAILQCIKTSIWTLKSRVKTMMQGFIDVEKPFFQVHVELVMPRVRTSPALEDVQLAINRCALAILRSIRITPWVKRQCAVSDDYSMKDKVLSSIDLVPSVLVLTGCIERTKQRVQDYLGTFLAYDSLWKVNKQDVLAGFVQKDPPMDVYIQKLSELDSLGRDVSEIPNVCNIGPLSLSNDSLKASLRAEIDSWKTHFTSHLLNSALQEVDMNKAWMAELVVKLESKVRDLDEVKSITNTLQELLEAESDMDESFIAIEARIRVAEEFAVKKTYESHGKKVVGLRLQWTQLQRLARTASDKLRRTQENFKADLNKAVNNFVSEVKTFRHDFDTVGPMIIGLPPNMAIEKMLKFQRLYEEKARKLQTFQEGEELFGLVRTEFPELQQTQNDLHLLSQLYTLFTSCTKSVEGYLELPVRKLNVSLPGMTKELEHYDERMQGLPRVLWKYPAYTEMKTTVENLTAILPLVRMLINPAMRPRHWQEVMVITQTVLEIASPTFSVKDLLDANLQKHQHNLHDICQSAQLELQTEEKLQEVSGEWERSTLSFTNFKNTGPIILDVKKTRSLVLSMEEYQVTLHTLLNSQHSIPFREPINQLLAKFVSFLDLLDVWLGVQHTWWYVGVVFSGDDISAQLPQEAKRFVNVNTAYMALMQDAFTLRYVMMVHDQRERMFHTLLDLREQLEICQKFLTGYLDSKRDVFPRLYFVSDTVLLESLSSSSELNSLQPLLLALFDSVHSLVVDKRTDSVTAMLSEDGESLSCLSEISTELPVEQLLANVDEEMRGSLCQQAIEVVTVGQEQLGREELEPFFKAYQSQICVLGLQVWWTSMCNKLTNTLKKVLSLLERSTAAANANMQARHRMKLDSLLVTQLGQRDGIRELQEKGVKSIHAYDWQRQLRFNQANKPQDGVEVQTMGYTSMYSFEFVGCRKRLIATAITRRAFFYIIQAAAHCSCTVLDGPAGCGKTGTIRELGRQLGRYMLDFNCSGELTQSIVSGLVSGLCKSGAWGCFDELDRIQMEILSVIAQQIRTVLDAKRAGKSMVTFSDGRTSKVVDTTGIFSCHTKLEGEPKRLPENMKSLFRVLSMVEPDLETVAAVRLSAALFENAAILASKMRCLYHLCAKVLAGESHSHFGLRNLNVVLELVISLKRESEEEIDEMKAAALVLRDYNMPQLTEQDATAFNSFLFDLFPDISTSKRLRGYEGLEQTLVDLEEGGKVYPGLGTKALQLYESSTAYHALILVGPTSTGKTSSIDILMTEMTETNPHRAVFLNPLAMTIAQLFGWHDERSTEWRDGVFSAIWRKGMRNKSSKTWMIFDGPIDPLWMEHLNTVLDDTKVLTLANGDRVAMEEGTRVLFEVCSLRNATPDMVARCGVVAFESASISIQAIADMWLSQRRKEEQALLTILFDRFVNNVWTFALLECKPLQKVPPSAQMQCFLTLLSALLADYVEANEVPNKQVMERYVIFSLAWATMGLLDDDDRKKVDARISEITPNVPAEAKGTTRGTILNHFFKDVNPAAGQLQLWENIEVLCKWSFPLPQSPGAPGAPPARGSGAAANTEIPSREELVVPTVQTKTIEHLAQLLQTAMHPLLLLGEAGSGKTTIARSVRAQHSAKYDRRMLTHSFALSRTSSPQYVQNMLEKVVRKRGAKLYGPPDNRSAMIQIDDVNLPQANEWGNQPTAEVLRDLMEQGGLQSQQALGERNTIVDLWIFAVGRTAVGGQKELPERMIRHMFPVLVPFPNKLGMQNIFDPIVSGWVKTMTYLDEDTRMLLHHCSPGTIELFLNLRKALLPFRSLQYFTLDLHNIANVLHGMMRVPGRNIYSQSTVISLWRHECEREMLDQLAEEQASTFDAIIHSTCLSHFGVDLTMARQKDPMFGDVTFTNIVPPPKTPPVHNLGAAMLIHEESNKVSPKGRQQSVSPRVRSSPRGRRGDDSPARLSSHVHQGQHGFSRASSNESNDQNQTFSRVSSTENVWSVRAIIGQDVVQARARKLLEEYNEAKEQEGSETLSLVLFPEIVHHFVRLVRILEIERGHAVLVGAAKCGKLSIAKLATFVAKTECISVSANKGTGPKQLKEALRKVYTMAGLHGKSVTLLMSVQKKTPQCVLEGVSRFIEFADNDDIFTVQEWDDMLQSKEMARLTWTYGRATSAASSEGAGGGEPELDAREILRKQVQRHTHVVMCMAMTRQEFSDHLMYIPSSCTIDLWRPWTEFSLDVYAQQSTKLLDDKIDEHTEMIARHDLRTDVIHKIKADMEAESLVVDRAPSWNQNDVEAAVSDAIKAHKHFLEDIKSRMRVVIPRQMAQVHQTMEVLRKEYNDEFQQTAHFSFANFRDYCEIFQKVFMKHFESLYARNVKLKHAVENLDRCEQHLSIAKGNFAESKNAVNAAAEVCDSILKDIKAQSTWAEKKKAEFAVVERELRIVQQKLEGEAEQAAQHVKILEEHEKPIQEAISAFTVEQVKEIHSSIIPVNDLVGRMMDTVMIVLGAQLGRISQIEVRGRKVHAHSWETVQQETTNPFLFLKRLADVDPSSITPEQAEFLQPYLTAEDFTYDRIRAVANGSCAPLYRWILGIQTYCKAKDEAAPKLKAYMDLQLTARALNHQSQKATLSMNEAQAEVEKFRKMYDDAVRKRQQKEKEEEASQRNFDLASGLIDGLKSQQRRWAKSYSDFQFEIHKLAGNSSISSAFQAYFGTFHSTYRQKECEERLVDTCRNTGVMLKMPPTVMAYLVEDTEVAQWRSLGLPADDSCSESAMFVVRSHGKQWSLLIDPHHQAAEWVTRMDAAAAQGENKTIHLQDENFMATLQSCVSFGIPMMVMGVDSDIEYDIDDLLNRSFIREAGDTFVMIDGKKCEYNQLFSICFATARLHPVYSRDFSCRVAVVNFSSSEKVLNMQMLEKVMQLEMPKEAAERTRLLEMDVDSGIELKKKQVELLELFATLEGSILESSSKLEELMNIKNELSKVTKGREEAKKRWTKIVSSIKEFSRVGQLGAQLLEVVTHISYLHPMYYTSTDQFLTLFTQTLKEVPANTIVNERIAALLATLPFNIYSHISEGLAAQHKPVWQLIFAIRMDLHSGMSVQSEIDAIMTVLAASEYEIEKPAPPIDVESFKSGNVSTSRLRNRKAGGWPDSLAWMSVEAYVGMKQLERNFKVFTERQGATLTESLIQQPRQWGAWFAADDPENMQAPLFQGEMERDQGLRPVEHLALVRWLRFDRFAQAARQYVGAVLDPRFLQPVAMDVEAVYKRTNPHMPVIIMLADGFSVLDVIEEVANRKHIPVKCIALGDKQRALAQKLMLSGPVAGQWLVLENGHLDLPYLATIPPIIKRMDYAHDHFRLFITTEMRKDFPSTLADIALRQSAEPPMGFKDKLWCCWKWMSQTTLDAVQEPEWNYLVYSLCFVHNLMISRRRFDFRGWSAPYEFHRRDLLNSLQFMERTFNTNAARTAAGRFLVPWQAIQQATSESLLGGSVTDRQDQVLLDTYVQRFVDKRVLKPGFEYAPGYGVPHGFELAMIQRHVSQLPDGERALLFGLNASTDLYACLPESQKLRSSVFSVMMRQAGQHVYSEKMSNSELSAAIESILRAGLPRDLDWGKITKDSLALHDGPTPMHLFLVQEIACLQQVVDKAKNVLERLRNSLEHGSAIVGDELAVAIAVKRGLVPDDWDRISWYSKSLTAWLDELNKRVEMLKGWAGKGKPWALWVGGLFNPMAFATHFLQEQCRVKGWTLDRAWLTMEVHSETLDMQTANPELTYVSGVILAGAGYDFRANKLIPAGREGVLRMPPLALVAREGQPQDVLSELIYRAPCYSSTRQRPPLEILEVQLKTDMPQQQLVLSRCSFFCRNDTE